MRKKRNRCSNCGQKGHYINTCKNPTLERPPKKARKLGEEEYREKIELRHPGFFELAGKVPDPEVAEKFGVSHQRVGQVRSRLGIPAFQERLELTPEQVDLLGTCPDSKLAKAWGFSAHAVRRARVQKGIPKWSVWDERKKILENHAGEIGKISDSKVAGKAGLTTKIVFGFRKREGIETEVIAPTHVDFVPIDRERVRKLFLEGHSDEKIADKVFSTKNTVARIRHELGLIKKSRAKTYPEEHRKKVVQEYLCCYSYSEVARRLGCSVSYVRKVCIESEVVP